MKIVETMKVTCTLCVLIILCFVAPGYCQAHWSDQWQPVAKEDLSLKDNPAEPGASAMILDRMVYADDEMRFQAEFVRIKILKEEGTQYADIVVPYAARDTSVEDIRGRTIRQDGTVIEFSGTVFDNIVAKRKGLSYQAKTFTLPGVEVGAVIEYSFKVHWKDRLPGYIRHPEDYRFDGGFALPTNEWVVQQELFTRHALFVMRPVKNGRLGWVNVRLTQNKPYTQADGSVKLEVANVPAISEEEQMPPMSHLDSRVYFYYSVGYLGDLWYEYGKIMEEKEQKFLSVTHPLSRVVSEIAPSSESPETRLRNIYARVQQLRYISFEPSRTGKEAKREGLAKNESADDILRHGYAYGNEANLLFTALARAAGFSASIVEVSDRRKHIFDRNIPDPSQLGAMIVLVYLNGKQIFLDPGTRFCPYGLLPWAESDTGGVAWGKIRGEEIHVPPQLSESSATERTAELILAADGSLQGTAEITYKGGEALDKRLDAVDEDEPGRRRMIENEIKQWLPAGANVELASVSSWDATNEPLHVKCAIKIASYAAVSDRRMLFRPGIFQAAQRHIIASHNRVQPVYYDHAYRTVDRVTIALPPNYRTEALPEDQTITVPFGSYKITRSSNNGKVSMERAADMNGYYFLPDTYRSVWSYLVRVRNGDADNVVLQLEHDPNR